ncbi:DUF362 domain-containing protein [Flavonifractor sp. An10]|uniref:DUF362 domain-containing protein n=1 Tax=Flavonifractor sp. An10 TaxID=1965537 RepID=UPI000B364C91|nr:DUF362 domain-containing protein [Flavonifractor sp. An10]OUQ81886.1 4Fe-4S ferredoxin [Flavonifractor sp. An10]
MSEQAKVYYSDLRCRPGVSLLDKLKKLIRRAGIGEIDFDHKLVAIKMHFGEPGNLAFLRPNYAKAVADVVKELGGIPFLTDCNTLYPGRRKNALEHLDAAYENGFTPLSTGCQVIIGDGLRGNDDVEVPVAGAEYIQTAKIGKAIMEADVVISLSHFKGHEQTGFGGAIKNLGMGCGSRRGKMEQHAEGKPKVKASRCVGCRKCTTQCAHDAISFDDGGKASINWNRCVGCGRCIAVCNTDAIRAGNDCAMEELGCRMAEYAKAVVDGRPQFHISLVIDVSPYCDCHGENDVPILPDVGMFASADPVALDQACADACLRQQPIPGSHLDEQLRREGFCDHHDPFINSMPDTDWRVCLAHCEKIGVGSRTYELIEVK